MILQDNIATEIGDCIYFQTVPMLNIQTIISYTDSVTGEMGITRYFDREFQYSLDGGITFSDWANLNDGNSVNITQINLLLQSNFHQLVILFKFTRVGTDNTGQLQINTININGINVDRGSVFTVSGKSIFKDTVFNNINVLNLMINLAQKMYELGIVPAYITRKEEENGFMSDEAYIDFWQTVAYYYSVLTIDSIKFENVYWRRPLICEFLNERNIFLCDCTNMIQMQLIAQNFFTEIRVRGTEEIFKPAGYEYNIGYRRSYTLPTSYLIQGSTGVQIDGIVYNEISALPFGWVVIDNGQTLLSSDLNYHKVLFKNITTGIYDVPDDDQSIIFPTINSNIFKRYDGEYLRLICFNSQCDEFLYNNVSDIYVGWCLRNSSPIYKGLRPQLSQNLIKAYEKHQNVQNLSKYPLINPDTIYIGIANNPIGVSDTVMYISSDGSPCLVGVIPELTNVSSYLNINISSSVVSVSGIIKITNLLTLDEFDIPVTLNGIARFTIDTPLAPSRYSVELIFAHSGTMVSDVNDGAALEYNLVDTSGSVDALYSLLNVGSNIINVNLNFSAGPVSTSSLRLLFDDIANANALVGGAANVANWNTFFNTSVNATLPFTSVTIVGNEIYLLGATNLQIQNTLFQSNINLISILDDAASITAIGANAFNNCSALTNINFPVVQTIGDSAFANCASLITISFPSVININDAVFSGCISLTSINFAIATSIGDSTFVGCTSLTSVYLPNIINIAAFGLYNCPSLTILNLPSVKNIGFSAFANCTSLTTINLPVCIDLGGTTGDNSVFNGITGQSITLKILTATASDGDVVYLQANNTVILILV